MYKTTKMPSWDYGNARHLKMNQKNEHKAFNASIKKSVSPSKHLHGIMGTQQSQNKKKNEHKAFSASKKVGRSLKKSVGPLKKYVGSLEKSVGPLKNLLFLFSEKRGCAFGA